MSAPKDTLLNKASNEVKKDIPPIEIKESKLIEIKDEMNDGIKKASKLILFITLLISTASTNSEQLNELKIKESNTVLI